MAPLCHGDEMKTNHAAIRSIKSFRRPPLTGAVVLFTSQDEFLQASARPSQASLFDQPFSFEESIAGYESSTIVAALLTRQHAEKFTRLFNDTGSILEQALIRLLDENPALDFLILLSRFSRGAISHELAHAFYYCIPEHKALIDSYWATLPAGPKNTATDILSKNGYHPREYATEFVSHMFWGFTDEEREVFLAHESIGELKKILRDSGL
jgi:hypothetical protein